jgi:hypothetical protein
MGWSTIEKEEQEEEEWTFAPLSRYSLELLLNRVIT